MAKSKTKKKTGRKKGDTRVTSITIRGDAVDLLKELGSIVEEEVGIPLQPPQVLELALRNELKRRKEEA